jgi:hypothetical protein
MWVTTSPQTPEGTPNEATPEWLYNLLTMPLPGRFGGPIIPYGKMINPVRSYLTTDQNGRQIVVNVTEPGHMLHPGYVVRYVTPSDADHPERRRGLGKLAGIVLSAHASSGLDKQRSGGSIGNI